MASFYASEDFPVNKVEAAILKNLAAQYPESPTAEQEDEFRHNVCVELGWRDAAKQYFGLVGAPEREPQQEEE